MSTLVDKAALACSFCGKSSTTVAKLIAGPGVYICDECIALCNEILDGENDALPDWEGFDDEALVGLLRGVVVSRDRVDAHVGGVVREMRRRGVTWARIGEVLGITRQSAWERYSGEE